MRWSSASCVRMARCGGSATARFRYGTRRERCTASPAWPRTSRIAGGRRRRCARAKRENARFWRPLWTRSSRSTRTGGHRDQPGHGANLRLAGLGDAGPRALGADRSDGAPGGASKRARPPTGDRRGPGSGKGSRDAGPPEQRRGVPRGAVHLARRGRRGPALHRLHPRHHGAEEGREGTRAGARSVSAASSSPTRSGSRSPTSPAAWWRPTTRTSTCWATRGRTSGPESLRWDDSTSAGIPRRRRGGRGGA